MAARLRLAHLFDAGPLEDGIRESFRHAIQRRRLAARICMGQGVDEIARLEGVSVERAGAILAHPTMIELVRVWMAFLGRVRADRELKVLAALGFRLFEHELETRNGTAVNFFSRLWAMVGCPGRGLLQWTVRRFAALALQSLVRPRRERIDPLYPFDDPEPEERPEPTPEELAAKAEIREQLALARRHGMCGGLDLRYLPGTWSRGVLTSIFRKIAANIEGRACLLLPDGAALPVARPDPGPLPRTRFCRSRIWVPPMSGPTHRFEPVGMGFPGVFPVSPRGRVLPATVDLGCLYVRLAYEPYAGKPIIESRPAIAWRKRQAQARASPQAA